MNIIAIVSRSVAAGAVTVALWTALAGPGHAASIPAPAGPHGNPANGARLYQSCMGCHSLDDNDVGPKHRGVVGRKAGIVPGYAYSAALKKSGITWTPSQLDRWLSGPQAMVPGAKMYFSVANPQNRADIIAYLAQQK
ncbi:c-type cytochrome [Novosphingobium sp. G106]|uniref:c-type cytochrome n=1 Tax=Novosphingobium sp. G106 TaxID=2849500 RepID=UPI001C2D637A|nr:c-type cytochrome [Novosphingobium sp. G106]MBV1688817.1 c-type cytochrome [Novosphingobium sp. G106]